MISPLNKNDIFSPHCLSSHLWRIFVSGLQSEGLFFLKKMVG